MKLVLLASALFLSTSAIAQSDVPPLGDTYNPIPGPQLASPTAANPDYPLRVWLRFRHNAWDGTYEYYAGDGRLQFASTDNAKPIRFEYQCGVTFLKPAVNQYQARWIKPGKTLQIALAEPDRRGKLRTCKLSVRERTPLRTPAPIANAGPYNTVSAHKPL